MFAHAIELMNRSPLTFAPDTPIRDVMETLLAKKLDGVCVVEGEALLGVVTVMDLLFQERQVKASGFIARLLDRKALERVTAQKVSEIMSEDPVTVEPAADLEELATLMVDRSFTILPVVKDGVLLGVIDKWSVLDAISGEGVSDEPTHG